MFEGFVGWLQETPLTAVFSDTNNFWTWLIIPVSQCIHILAIGVVMVAMGMLNLRLIGVFGTAQSFGQVSRNSIPWIWTALIVLFLTGVIQTIAEPERELLNIGFKSKMVLLATAIAIMMIYESTGKKDPYYWERSSRRRKTAVVLASMSLVLWIGIATAGRMIAYLS